MPFPVPLTDAGQDSLRSAASTKRLALLAPVVIPTTNLFAVNRNSSPRSIGTTDPNAHFTLF